MRISIIISLFNCLELTRKCLESLEETVPSTLDHELILIDDGSTDGTREFLAEYARGKERLKVLLNDGNLGYARSNNRAAENATGTHLLFLNNDTELMPGWIEPMVDGYRVLRRKRPGIIGNVQRRVSDGRIDHAGVFINSRGKPDHEQIDPGIACPESRYSEHVAATGACILMPAELFQKVGCFGTEFQNGGEDMDLNFKVRSAGYRVFVANRSYIWHHVSASPGRNDHHERNTRIVFHKWRDMLIEQGARRWAKEYIEQSEHQGHFWSDKLYRHCVLYGKGLKSKPPAEAYDAVTALVVEQEEVWEKMFGPFKS